MTAQIWRMKHESNATQAGLLMREEIARLKATNKDLLAALEDMLSQFEDNGQYDDGDLAICDQARAAIKLAKGK